MLESGRPLLLDHNFAACSLGSHDFPLACKKARPPSADKYHTTSRPFRYCPSKRWTTLTFRGFHCGYTARISRSSPKWWEDRKDLLLCQAIPDDDDDEDDQERDYAKIAAPPATVGRIDIAINKSVIEQLDLSPAHAVLSSYVKRTGGKTQQDPKELLRRTVGFVIDYQWDDPYDMRELSEMPDVRLWFVLLDAMYPWLPVVLDWRAGELARYAAMLVPHQMKKKEGLVFNPEGLELFVMSKLFTVYPWLLSIKVAKADVKVMDMLKVLGFNIEAELFQLLESP